MMYKKLRFLKYCTINYNGKQIECRIVYGDFYSGGYDRGCYIAPEIVIDKQGKAYRPGDICGNGWIEVNDIYLKRIGLTKRQIFGTAKGAPSCNIQENLPALL